jgi:antitoxin (DNA-binding transcriptional repressor) of toxin-antitoxin stability system
MKTLTVTEARSNLTAVLDRVCQGEDIGIIAGHQVIQLKPVEVVPWEDSYLYQEYGVGPDEWKRFKKRMEDRRAKEKYTSFEGEFDPKAL